MHPPAFHAEGIHNNDGLEHTVRIAIVGLMEGIREQGANEGLRNGSVDGQRQEHTSKQ